MSARISKLTLNRLTLVFAVLMHVNYVQATPLACSWVFKIDLRKAEDRLMSAHTRLFESKFHTSGFESYDLYVRELKKNPILRAAFHEIESMQNIGVGVRVAAETFEDILTSGEIKNQHETLHSSAVYDLARRNAVEASLLGTNLPKYRKLKSSVKPKYGYLAARAGGPFSDNRKAIGYGDVLIFLKDKKMQDRMTVTKVDSLGLPRIKSLPWDSFFVPWKNRGLIVPFLAERLINERVIANNFFYEKIGDRDFKFGTDYGNNSYIEVQIWGKVTLEDIDSVVFYNNAPTESVIERLNALNIQVSTIR